MESGRNDTLPPPPPGFLTSPDKFSTPIRYGNLVSPELYIPPPPPEENMEEADDNLVSDHEATLPLDASALGIGRTSRNELTCRCYGPNGDTCSLTHVDNEDGTHTIRLVANEPGVHKIEAEWGGKKVPGSPFVLKLKQHPDKNKVKVYGPGLFSGLLERNEGTFNVDTTGAGPGGLRVNVHGPKDGFDVRIRRSISRERVLDVSYGPCVDGIYTINVLWCGEHVPGSPYEVFLAHKVDELVRWNTNRNKIEVV